MGEKTQLQTAIGALNEALGDVTPYKLDVIDPKRIRPVDKNARYMSKRTFDQLVGNIDKDQNLSSLPFCWKASDGAYVVLSGNHRVEAAVTAKVPEILILYTDKTLSESERIAVQLSHNAIVGQDSPQVLKELWDRLDILDLKVYSGLDETLLASMPRVNIAQISEARLRFEYLTLLFMPTELVYIGESVKQAQAVGKGERWAADVADFDQFFDLFLEFKEVAGVLNSSTAFKMIIDLLTEWLQGNRTEQGDVITQT